MPTYRVFITADVLTIPPPSSRDRQQILTFLHHLGDDPFQTGDYQDQDDTGRPVQIKIIGKFALTSWADHSTVRKRFT